MYDAELQAVRTLLPSMGTGVEIGVGTGRFAQPLGMTTGVDPSAAMRAIAENRGITVYDAVAEALPFHDGQFDFALMVTTICFLDDVGKAFREVHRILKQDGSLVVAFIDKNSPLGRFYETRKAGSPFYRSAIFYSVDQVMSFLKQAGFRYLASTQVIFPDINQTPESQPLVQTGYGEGSFVIIKSVKVE